MCQILYTFPQSVGIAGGRPSSSYYFVGSQADNLFYLDPHHARPAVPLRPPPSSERANTTSYDPRGSASAIPADSASGSDREQPTDARARRAKNREKARSPTSARSAPLSPSAMSVASGRSSRSALSGRAGAVSPQGLQQAFSASSADSSARSYASSPVPPRWRSVTPSSPSSERPEGEELDEAQMHYATAYSAAELRTFHCDRVRKMPLSGLDPSMLIGFLCKDESDWKDLRARLADVSIPALAPRRPN